MSPPSRGRWTSRSGSLRETIPISSAASSRWRRIRWGGFSSPTSGRTRCAPSIPTGTFSSNSAVRETAPTSSDLHAVSASRRNGRTLGAPGAALHRIRTGGRRGALRAHRAAALHWAVGRLPRCLSTPTGGWSMWASLPEGSGQFVEARIHLSPDGSADTVEVPNPRRLADGGVLVQATVVGVSCTSISRRAQVAPGVRSPGRVGRAP